MPGMNPAMPTSRNVRPTIIVAVWIVVARQAWVGRGWAWAWAIAGPLRFERPHRTRPGPSHRRRPQTTAPTGGCRRFRPGGSDPYAREGGAHDHDSHPGRGGGRPRRGTGEAAADSCRRALRPPLPPHRRDDPDRRLDAQP